MVAPPGLEPGSPYGRQILSLLRIPISPWGPMETCVPKQGARLKGRKIGATIMPRASIWKHLDRDIQLRDAQTKTAAQRTAVSKHIKAGLVDHALPDRPASVAS